LFQGGEWKMSRALSYDHGPIHYVNLRTEIMLPDSLLGRYTGTYKGPQNGNVLIAAESGHLSLTLDNNKFALFAETKDRFFMRERDLTFTFGGTPQKMVVRENGNITEELVRQ
jgi:hypothetical protein